jgi:cell division protein FtsQ
MVAAAALLAGGWVWLRNSSLVAVQRVQVTGVSGPDAAQIRRALIASARNMTTLNVQLGNLHNAVSPYPVVKGIEVSTQFPHGMRIRVLEQVPVAVVVATGRHIAVSADGTLLRDALASSALPSITLAVVPGGTRVTGAPRAEVRMLAAAPYPLLAKISDVSTDPTHGLVAQLRNGPKVFFGGGDQLGAKWSAAAAVLADAGSAGADYIDVTEPSRPAAGPGPDTATTASPSPAGASATSTVGG